jgi:ABC-type multidrug transport system fused ATPase/permease subunit
MKKYILLLVMLFPLSLSSFAKDIHAWKNETSLERQYEVFKENLNFWNGNYFLNETQLNEFYRALTDSIAALENEIGDKAETVNTLRSELNTTNQQLENAKAELETSIKNQNAISVFGQNIDKSIYTLFMSLFILALLVFLGIVFLLYRRSNVVTVRTKKDLSELKQEFEIHKKNALERYTKINMELHRTRMEKNRQ